MSDYIAIRTADGLIEAASQQREHGKHIKVRTEGDQVSWSVDKLRSVKQVFSLGLYGKAQAKDFKAGLQTLANQTHANLPEAERNKGHEATVSFGEHRIAAGAFADNIGRINVSSRGSFADAVLKSPIWNDVRHVAAPVLPTVEELTQQQALRDAAKAEGRARLEGALQAWSQQSNEVEARHVVHQVLSAYDDDADELTLTGWDLKSIPPLEELKSLKTLHLASNKLTSLDSLSKSESLQWLNVSGNPLFTLPANLGEKLPNLENINISRTLVSKLPPNINLPRSTSVVADNVPFLTHEAVRIILRNTQSNGFAHRLPADHELLRAVRVRNNPHSLNFEAIRNRAKNLGVPPEVIQAAISEVRGFGTTPSGPAPVAAGHAKITDTTSFEDNIAFYYQSLGREVPAGLVDKLKAPLQSTNERPTDGQVDNLRRDLHRFTAIKDALASPEKTADLARRIVAILDAAVESEVFRDHLYSVAGDASGACEDRAAVGLGRLEQEAHLLRAVSRETIDPAEIRQLFRETAIVEAATTLATEEGLKRVAADPNAPKDEIEWVLSYLTVLRDRGHLSSGSSDLKFRDHFGFQVDKVKADIPKILERAKGSQAISITLQRVPSWADKLADIWPPFKAEQAAIAEQFDAAYIKIEDDFEAGNITAGEWADRINRLEPQRRDAIAAAVEKHTERWLASKS